MKQRHSAKHLFWRMVIAAFGNTAMATGLYPVVPHVGLLVARRRKGLPSPPNQLRSVATEWAVAVAMSAARPIGFFGLPVRQSARGPRPVIVLHGYAMSRVGFLPLARRITRAGLGPVHGFEYWTLGKVSSAARRLGHYVESVCSESGLDQVDLVGHSMGGLVSRYYLVFGGGAKRVRNLITLGSPHGGADLSGVGFGRPTRELYPGSAFLQRLEATEIPSTTNFTTIWSRSDALVSGVRSARLRGVEELVYDDLGHLTLLTDRRVAADIITRLSR